MVTNPATRDWTVTASAVRDPERDVRQSHGLRHRSRRLGRSRHQRQARPRWRPARIDRRHPRTRQRRDRSNTTARRCSFPWSVGAELEVWVAAYGPKALTLTGEVGDGFILQLADPDIAEWMITDVRDAAADAGRDPTSMSSASRRPRISATTSRTHARPVPMVRRAWSATTSPTSSLRYGADPAPVPTALTDYIKGRQGYDYNEHGRAGNTHAEFVPDEIVDRFCLLGTVDAISSGSRS